MSNSDLKNRSMCDDPEGMAILRALRARGFSAEEIVSTMRDMESAYPIPGDPASMTPELRADLNAYGFLVTSAHRTDAEDAEMQRLKAVLLAAGCDPGWEAVPRRAITDAELAVLRARDTAEARALEPSAPVWLDSPPPRTEPGKPVYVWCEGCEVPVSVMYSEGERGRPPGMVWLKPGDHTAYRYEAWGDARWAPIPRPA